MSDKDRHLPDSSLDLEGLNINHTPQNVLVVPPGHSGETRNVPVNPPSFAESQFDIILRRQRTRQTPNGGSKFTESPSRFHKLSNEFEFAGWGGVYYLELTPDDSRKGERICEDKNGRPLLSEWTASALAANDVFGGVFYSLPPVVVVAGVFSPISLFIATLVPFIWRPILRELTSAFPTIGSNYTYLMNVTAKPFALIAAAVTLLDYAATLVVSSATASTYLAGEIHLPFPVFVGTILIVAFGMVVTLCGLKESARLGSAILSFHLLTMLVLMIVSAVAWARMGTGQLRQSWTSGSAVSVGSILKQIFSGFCISTLSLTGTEFSPDYVNVVRPGRYYKVARNVHLPGIFLYAPLMLFVFAILPLETILNGANVLSILAEKAAGPWMRIWVVIDAMVVLSTGVMSGTLCACALCERLAQDQVIPRVFLYRLPVTRASAVSIFCFGALGLTLYATSGANLSIMSKVFALAWLATMAFFPISLLLLKYNRGRIFRDYRTPLWLPVFALCVAIVIFAGNVVIDPSTLRYFLAYAVAMCACFVITNSKTRILRWVYWIYDQTPFLHRWLWLKRKSTGILNLFKGLRQQPVCVLSKTDEIHFLFRMISYVAENEETSCVKIVHFYEHLDCIPSELEANAKLLDEAFPDLTIDLVFVQTRFTPASVAAVAQKLHIPRSLMFMSCPGRDFGANVVDYGTRVITL